MSHMAALTRSQQRSASLGAALGECCDDKGAGECEREGGGQEDLNAMTYLHHTEVGNRENSEDVGTQ